MEFMLSTGLRVLVDDIDADLANKVWSDNNGYCMRVLNRPGYVTETLHEVIMRRVIGRELTADEEVDHINRVRSDNTRDNLRIATRMQNMANQGIRKNNTSGYKGVNYDSRRKKWYVQIRDKDARITFGSFDTPELAAIAYNEKAKELHGDFAYQNVIAY